MSEVVLSAVAHLPPDADLVAAAGEVDLPAGRLDGICQAGLAVAHRALRQVDRGALGEPLVVLGTTLGCLESDAAYYRQLVELGLLQTNPRIFAYTLPNVVLGETAIALRLTGENLLFDAGRASGLVALGEAAEAVRSERVSSALVLVVDVVGPATRELFAALGTTPAPFAAAFVLRRVGPGVARIGGFRSGFDPDATAPLPDPDPLGAAGLAALLEPVGAARTLEARCPSGYWAQLDVAPA